MLSYPCKLYNQNFIFNNNNMMVLLSLNALLYKTAFYLN